MIRVALSFVIGFFLILIQSTIVMKLNAYENIYFPNLTHLLVVWIVNFFFVFSLISQLKTWLENSTWVAKRIK